jgi:hypothetical protein
MIYIPVLRVCFTVSVRHVGNAKNGRLLGSFPTNICGGIGGGYRPKNYIEKLIIVIFRTPGVRSTRSNNNHSPSTAPGSRISLKSHSDTLQAES